MNSISEENQKAIEYLLTNNHKLKGLTFNNNTLFYQDKSVDLKDLNLKVLIMHNQYDRLSLDLKEDRIDALDFFNIIEINTYKIQEEENEKNQLLNYALEFLNKDLKEDEIDFDIISTSNYFKMAKNKNALNNNDLAKLNKYEEYIGKLMPYIKPNDQDDYLIPEQRILVVNYINKCKELIENGFQNSITIKYQDISKQANNSILSSIKRQEKTQKKAGFANALIVILLILIAGIIIGLCGYYFI